MDLINVLFDNKITYLVMGIVVTHVFSLFAKRRGVEDGRPSGIQCRGEVPQGR